MDFWYQAETYDIDINMSISEIDTSSTDTFNYTLIEELYGSEYNLSPRFTSDAYLERYD